MLSLVIKILLIFTLLDLTRGQEDSPTFSINPSWAHVLKNITIPDIPRKKVGEGTCSNSNCSPGECNTCWETCGSCPGDKEIYGCKNPQHWSLTFDDGPT
ncbi:chitin deacetylase [Basidiobolus ranarum]|uniref:Chitin deacetylase n=1 Tax=Basidiobolus ranarum TaxID=34480 RepID=A0ABR2WLQ6_9FUNG